MVLLQEGVAIWNMWRGRHPDVQPDLSWANLSGAKLSGVNLNNARLIGTNFSEADLSEADLSRADLGGANFSRADLSEADLSRARLRQAELGTAYLRDAKLSEADLSEANLSRADLSEADLSGANLSGANLSGANLFKADISGADLSGADFVAANLSRANFSEANLCGANFGSAVLIQTILANIDLGKTNGLDKCEHYAPSVIDFQTLSRSDNLPISFLRGCGLPDTLIEYLPSVRGDAFQFYSCFISYSTKNQLFAERLHADLQNQGVRCWFAPHDLPIGAKIWDAIDEAIRLRDKLLVILSAASIASDWVEDEVNKAYAEERERKETVLFSIRIDDTVMIATEPWARKLRDQRHIGDFRQWNEPVEYQKSLARLLRDLKASATK
jgi:uncharacterized protein YjbI with pentapeptide repeats